MGTADTGTYSGYALVLPVANFADSEEELLGYIGRFLPCVCANVREFADISFGHAYYPEELVRAEQDNKPLDTSLGIVAWIDFAEPAYIEEMLNALGTDTDECWGNTYIETKQ